MDHEVVRDGTQSNNFRRRTGQGEGDREVVRNETRDKQLCAGRVIR